MKSSAQCAFVTVALCLSFLLCVQPIGAQQKAQPTGRPIDIDKELRAPEPQDRGKSYYHFAIAKWQEDRGDLGRAVEEMRKALSFNENSIPVRLELASLYEKMGRLREALEEAQEASRLDPKNPESHWLLATIYLRGEGRGRSPSRESLRKAAKELETMREDAPDDERAWYALGSVYFELGEPDKAIAAYEKYQTLEPGSDGGYLAIARYHDRSGNPHKAIEYLEKAVAARPNSPESLMMLATHYSRARRDKEAIVIFRKLLELTGENAAVKRQLASSLIDTGEVEEANRVLDELAEAHPQDLDIKVMAGRARLAAQKYSEAIGLLKTVVDENPDHMEAAFYLAEAYEKSGRTAEAVPILEGLLQKSKSSEEYRANRRVFEENLASGYLELGENQKATALYEDMLKNAGAGDTRPVFLLINAYRIDRQLDKALALGKEYYEKNPAATDVALVYARTLADAGRTREGADILNRLLQTDPSNVDIYVNLSQVYLQGKKYADAEKVLRKAEEKQLDSERVKFQLGAVYERQKEFDRAETLFKEVLKTNPKNTAALNYIGYMLADRGVRLDEAVRYVEEALALDPDNGSYLDSLGWAFFKLNDLEKAEQYLQKAVSIQKKDPVIQDHLGDLYFKTGDYEKARDYWTRSIEAGTEPDEMQKTREKLARLKEVLDKQRKRRQ